MAESVVLVTQPRSERGSGAARRLRRNGLVPGVIYGHKEENLAVSLSADALMKAIRQGAHVVDFELKGKQEKALIREVQWDYLGKDLVHVDFERVSADETITVTVPIEIRGTAPGIAQGGVLDQPLHNLSIECLALNIPDSIRVNVGELQIDQAIHVRDLVLPEGVKATGNPDTIVVHVTAKVVEEVAPAAPEVAGAAEPEVIARKPAAPEEAEAEEAKKK
jgi:large subunit ribosomal protein L25